MKHVYQGILVLVLLLLSLTVVFGEDSTSSSDTGFSAQISFDWLADQIGSDGSIGQDVSKTALSIMALDSVGYDTSDSQTWLASQLSTDYCYPTGSCTTSATSFASLALYEVQDDTNFDGIAAWYQGALSDADVSGEWDLEVVTSGSGTCVVSYELEGTLQEIEISVDAGVFSDCDSSHFLNLDDCLQSGLISSNPGITLDVDCSDLEGSVVLTELYRSSSTYYILANENAAQAEFQVNNGCFGKSEGSSCDIESTLYSGWALSKLGSSINTLVYLKEHYDDSEAKRIALMYLVTKDSAYLADLASLQKSDGSFDRDAYTTALAVLALSEDSSYSSNVDDAKSYLREEQGTEGDWGGSVENTALVLYAAFSDEDVTPSTISSSTGTSVSECDTNADCELLYGDGYSCDEGDCTFISSTGGCQTDSDCDTGEVCLDDTCVESDCDYGQYCTSGKTCCDYASGYNENVYNCPSDCSCGDGVCDDIEEDASSGDEYYCAEDCGEAEEESGCDSDSDCRPYTCDNGECGSSCSSDDDCSSGYSCEDDSCTLESSSGSGWILYVVLFLILIGIGVGGYFAYKKGMLDSLLSKFKKGGGSQTVASSYNPFTSKLPQQQSPFGGSQPKRPF